MYQVVVLLGESVELKRGVFCVWLGNDRRVFVVRGRFVFRAHDGSSFFVKRVPTW